MAPGLIDRSVDVLERSAEVTDQWLEAHVGIGLPETAIVIGAVVVGIAALRWGYNKLIGKSSPVYSLQNETRERAAFAFA